MLIYDNGHDQSFIIELYHNLIDIRDGNFIFPDGWSQLRDTPPEAPNEVKIINGCDSTSDNNVLDLTWDLRMQLN